MITLCIPQVGRDVFTNKVHDKVGDRYRIGKRQISKKELRGLGLANG